MQTISIIVAALLAIVNVAATVVALRSETSTTAQRMFQACVVWLIPLLGAFVVILFHRLDRRSQGSTAQPMRLDGSEIDVGLAARHDGQI